MANPFAFNDPFGDPFGSSNPFMPKRAPASASLPTLTPEEEQSLLGSVMEEGIGGLGYVGKILDKTFGGRAVRGGLGLLTGQGTDPSELLSFLPMSDTLGLTKERNAVQGTDLLANAGLITPGDTGWQNQLAGVGTEIALDPATYLGAPAIKAVAGLYGKGASGLGRLASAPISLATGGAVDPFAFGARVGGNLLEKGTAVGRALFDPSVHGTWNPEVQKLATDVYDPLLRSGRDEARMAHAEAMVPLKGVIGDDLKLQDEIGRAIQTRAEGFGSSADARLQAAGLDPAQIQNVYGTVDPFLGRVKSTISTEQGVGSGTREFADIPRYVSEANDAAHAAGNALPYPQDLPFPNYQPAEYFPRTLAQYPESEGFFRSASNRLSGNTGFQKSREDIFRGIPGGTNMIEDLVRNPELSGKVRTLSDLDVEDRLTTLLSNKRPGLVPLDDPVRAQAASLGDYLKTLPEVSQQRGLFSSDALGAGLSRLEESARVKASGETILEGIGRFARPVSDLEREGVKHVRVPDMINAAGLDYVDPVTKMPVAADRAATRLGLTGPAATSELRNYAVPADVAQDMARMGQAFKVPESIAPVVAAWDSLTNFFKTSLTTLFPAFHTRNGMSGLFNMWRDSALDTKALGSAANVIRGGLVDAETAAKVYNTTPEAATQELLKEVMGKRLAFTRNNQTSDAVGAVRRGLLPSDVPEVAAEARPIAEDIGNWMKGFGPGDRPMSEAYNPLNIAGVRGDTDVFRPVAQGRAVGNSVEDFLRMGHYLGKRRAGFGVDEAAESVAKYQLDYSQLSSFEKGVMKRVMPWYCMPIDHQILTRDGFKFYDQLEIGEEVLAYDNGILKWTPLLEVAEFDYDGELDVFSSRGASFEFTPNHRWVSTVSGRDQTPTLREACNLNSTHNVVMTGSYHADESVLSPRLAAILGWIVTDGHIRWRGTHCEMVVYQSAKKYATVVGDLLGVEPRLASDDRQYHKVFTFAVKRSDVEAISAVIQHREQLPEVVTCLSSEAAESMYVAMMQAEGFKSYADRTGDVFAQSPKNWHVRDAFQILCLLTDRIAFASTMGCCLRKKKTFCVKDWRSEKIKYKGKIWCPRTEFGTWIVKHAGAVSVTGNTFSRRTLPNILEDLATKPAKLAGSIRVATGERQPYDFVPGFIGEGASLPIPGAPEGGQRYVSSFGLPFEDESIKAIGSALHGDPTRTLQQLIGMGQPIVKLPIEAASGTQLYSGRKLEDLRPSEYSQLGGLLPEDRARQVSQLVANSPLSRFGSSLDKLIDERKGTLPTLLNLGFGSRISDVDMIAQRDIAAREALKQQLHGMPGVRSREDVYVPADQISNLDPSTAYLYALLKKEEKTVADAQKAKKKQDSP